jgi:mono/diheme cytochrome c family protein
VKKVLKWVGIVLGILVGLVLLVALGLYTKTRVQINKTYDVQVEAVTIPTDAESVAHGEHIATILCMECHGDDLGGNPTFASIPGMAEISTPNITSGRGGAGSELSDTDWVRILRHGVLPEGRSVFLMPSNETYYLSDEDLGDLLAYVKSVPPVDREISDPPYSFTFLGGVLSGAGLFGDLLRADDIDQVNRPADYPEPGVTAEYGKYLVDTSGCRSCHGDPLAGGKPTDPAAPLAPNLTPGGELTAWEEADFIRAMRTGVALSGHELDPRFMPWTYKGKMTDEELQAMWAYLESLPALPTSTEPSEQ